MKKFDDIANKIFNSTLANLKTASASKERVIQFFKQFGATVVNDEDFYGEDHGGLWLRNKGPRTEDYLDLDYLLDNTDLIALNEKVEAKLKSMGWFSEPYDSGTLMFNK